jgi:NADH:ubiquinone reductase (H+-translocating)
VSAPHRVVVVGGGFGGLQAVSRLRGGPVEITLVDRRNFHLFQPLVYQVATGVLALGEISFPLRRVFRRDRNVRVVLGEVTGFDLAAREVLVDRLPNDGGRARFGYDSLIVAAGSEYTYLGHDEWRALAPDVKSPESALEVRRRLMTAFEAAELETDDSRREAWLTFVVIGGGPTGVELAGQIGELTREMLRSEYRTIDTSAARILLVEVAPRVLPEFPPRLSQRAAEALEAVGATPLVGHRVVEIDARSVVVDDVSGARVRVPARTVIWAAGVAASELAAALAAQSATDVDRHGRVAVGPDLSLAGHPEVTAIGDLARVHDADGKPLDLPGLAPVAMQQGRHAARAIEDRLRGLEPRPFRYLDKGNLATVGRGKAVARIRRLELSGLPAWITWLVVHLFYLLGVQNRLVVFVRWAFSYFVRRGGAQLITGVPAGGPPSTDTGGPTDAHDDASAGSPHFADDRVHGMRR